MGPWDRALGTCDGTHGLLVEEAGQAGFRVPWLSHGNAFCLPVAWPARMMEMIGRARAAKFPRVPTAVNSLLERGAALERKVIRRRPLPVELTLLAVLTR
jgi:hypothetical protein